MKTKILFIIILMFASIAEARVSVKGYVKSNGTYVAPHVRSNPNHSKYDNYSTRGNINPYTGKKGTVNPAAPRSRRRR